MIGFGKYLLSQERENRLKQTSIANPESLPYDEKWREVFDADFANWQENNKLVVDEYIPITRDCSYPQALQAIIDGHWVIRKYAYGRFVINKYPENRFSMTELECSVHHNYIPSFEDQMANDWIIITDPYYFKQR